MKLEKIILDNGLKVFFLNDNDKHTTYINLIVNYGGIDNKFKVNNKVYTMKDGMAHFIEHLVLESTKYGDLMHNFGKIGIRSNGLTYINRTQFYIDTVDHIYDSTKVLIKGIHSPIINKEVIDNIKKPILEEKRRSLDNKYNELYTRSLNNILDNNKYKTILGELKDIENIKESDIRLCFESFYRPSNEVIVVAGRFDREEMINTIKDAYNSLEFSNSIVNKVIAKHKNKVNKEKDIIKSDLHIDRGVITIKLDTKHYTPYDKLQLDLCLSCFLRMNFGLVSKFNKEMIDKKIINNGIGFSNYIIEGYNYIKIDTDSNRINEFVNNVIEYLDKKEFVFDEELFNLYKKSFIINLILRDDNIYNVVDPFIENFINFNYEDLDKISDLENTSFNNFKKSIEKLDFSNYSITILKQK
ncbi:MAG: insulinase family protein [Bacilli bacterium]|nr:insulinase family protein [Bacilli bacterium]